MIIINGRSIGDTEPIFIISETSADHISIVKEINNVIGL